MISREKNTWSHLTGQAGKKTHAVAQDQSGGGKRVLSQDQPQVGGERESLHRLVREHGLGEAGDGAQRRRA